MTITPTDSGTARQDLVDRARRLLPDLVRLRRDLHAAPEIGLHLPRTQAAVLDALSGLGLRVLTGTVCSSVVAVLDGALPGDTVLLRTDMDALPIVEESGEDFAADNGAMHACGHDLHTAGLVGAAHLLAAAQGQLAGRVVFAFQPGEEGHDGAQVMLDEGLLTVAGTPPVAAYAAHVHNGQPGMVFTRPGALLASMSELHVTVRGRGGHASAPHRTLDPVPVLAEITTALQAYVTRRHDVFDPVVVSVTRLRAADAGNVIPDTAELVATVRTLSTDALDKVRVETQDLAGYIARAHGLATETSWTDLYPVTCNDPTETATALRVARGLLGPARVHTMPDPLMGSEDFAKVLARVPGALLFLGATPVDLDPATAPALHSPRVRFADDHLHVHAALLTELAMARTGSGVTPQPKRMDGR